MIPESEPKPQTTAEGYTFLDFFPLGLNFSYFPSSYPILMTIVFCIIYIPGILCAKKTLLGRKKNNPVFLIKRIVNFFIIKRFISRTFGHEYTEFEKTRSIYHMFNKFIIFEVFFSHHFISKFHIYSNHHKNWT